MAVATGGGRSSPGSAATSTGTGARLDSISSAGARPRSVSTAGWMPRSSSRSSVRPACSSRLHQPGAGGAKLLDLGAELGRQALVLERQRRGGARGAHELRLAGERRVVSDRPDATSLQLDLGPRAVVERHGAALGVNEALQVR